MNNQGNFLTQLFELYKSGAITQKNYMKQINQTDKTPTVKQVNNLQKTVRANATRGYNKAKKVVSNALPNIHKNIAEGNKLIQKMDMQFEMQAINKVQSVIKAQSKKTFDKATELIEKLDKKYPNEQILELPRIHMTLSKEKTKLGIDKGSLVEYWEKKHDKTDKYAVNVSVQYRIWNETEAQYEEGTVGTFQYEWGRAVTGVTNLGGPPAPTDMPKNLSWEDKYLFLLYVWCQHPKYTSGCYIVELGGTIIFMKYVDALDLRMAGTLFHNKLVDAINNGQTIVTKVGECVQGYIWELVKGQYGFNNYTKQKLFDEINYYVEDAKKRPSTRDILNWRDGNHKNVSVYGLDPMYKTFVASPATDTNTKIKLVFQVKNGHCYPILNEVVKTLISKKGNIKSCCDVMKWNDTSDKLYECKDESDVFDIIKNNTKEDTVCILPKKCDLKTVLIDSIFNTRVLPEYFHYNSKNMLDGFLSQGLHTMFVADNDYHERKTICEQIYKIYPNDMFKFKNQGFTTIATQLFNNMFGFIPVSEYNEKVGTPSG